MLPENDILHDADISAIVRHLLGAPNRHGTRGHRWRYGGKGSLCVDVEAGSFMDFQSGEGGGLFDLIRHQRGGSRADAAQWLKDELGSPTARQTEEGAPQRCETATHKESRPAVATAVYGACDDDLWRQWWRDALPPEASPVARYLASRGLSLPAEPARVLRFHPACPFGAERLPAMLALIRNAGTGQPQGVHRTALTAAGDRARDADGAKLPKMMKGTAAGGAVMLSPDWAVEAGLGIAEGIETALAALRRAPHIPTWAALSAGGVMRFPILAGIDALTVYADADQPGIAASRSLCQRYAEAGRFAELIRPKRSGADMADLAA